MNIHEFDRSIHLFVSGAACKPYSGVFVMLTLLIKLNHIPANRSSRALYQT